MSILRADSIRDRAGTGAPDFPNGLTGNVTGTATVATNAQGITGTPNITVGTVTGTDATFSGNLTVNGTTTTIDTAVTSVDSLAVDGNVGIGTTNALAKLHVNLATDRNVVFNIDGNGQSRISSFNDAANASQILGLNGSALNFQTSNTERFRVTSAGHLEPVADNTYDLGGSGNRWRNIYTGDLNLSNEGAANDVDGTWGQYTIQEGENDLFMINKRTGKKYKFNLTEVE